MNFVYELLRAGKTAADSDTGSMKTLKKSRKH